MINKILIKNYRSIKKLEINNISNSLGLIGENSSGKSSILSAILTFLGEYDVKDSDFRFSKDEEQETEIVIGVGLDFDDFSIKRIMHDIKIDEKTPPWYSNALEKSKGRRARNIESKSYINDLKQNIKKEWGISRNSTSLYFNIIYKKSKTIENKKSKTIEKEIFLTTYDFKENKEIKISQKEIEQIKNTIQPRYAYLRDERNFNQERLGETDSTTNKLFSLLLPHMNVKRDLEDNIIEETPISELSIPQINQYLLRRIQFEAQKVTTELNRNFKESYDDDVEIEWQFSNQFFENISIKTNFKFSGTDSNIDFQSIGSGTRSMYKIALLQTLVEMQKDEAEPVLFLLEEPELYLYPKLEKQMSKLICGIAKENQVFVTTHSHMSIISFKKGSFYEVYRDKKTKRPLPVSKIRPIGSSLEAMKILGYDVTYLLGKDYIIFVEGKDDQKAYECLVNTIFGKSYSSKFMTMSGVNKLEMAVNCSLLKYINTNSKSVFIIDSDGGESEKIKEKAIEEMIKVDKEVKEKDLHNRIIVTKYCMLECYTFEKDLLINDMTDEEFARKKVQFIDEYKEDINEILYSRNKSTLDELIEKSLSDEQKFDYIRKYGFTKKLIKKFRGVIGGAGFKKIDKLDKKELEKYCHSLIQDLKKVFDLK
ncbi:AAA family ATPase [Actinomyces sp. zg-332]|uniref:ATP-dependent nuclease n=1 Tax=Actinomyces sp. zg-332 TaxID=2708340 RepID=UPI0014226480|nr:AAA family ATPase [Actinomyces sp. zg-332]QPK93863.1 AAA family ATPase [Actinomyces sp. zg-332]